MNAQEPHKRIYFTQGYMDPLFQVASLDAIPDDTPHFMHKLLKLASQQGIQLLQADSLENLKDFDYLIVFEIFPHQIPALARLPKEKLILFLWEPPSVLPHNFYPEYHALFSKIYTWNDALVDNKTYFKFYYPSYKPMIQEHPAFDTKTLCTMVAGNRTSSHPDELYSERRRVIEFFERIPSGDFDLLGRGWPTHLKNYKGAIDNKIERLKLYKFCFSYENVKGLPGYITEKIFDCFQAGVVPIYWGAPNVERFIPKGCFIAREDFTEEATLYEFMKTLSEEKHAEYIRNISHFLKSDQAKLFTIDHLVSIIMDLITPNARN